MQEQMHGPSRRVLACSNNQKNGLPGSFEKYSHGARQPSAHAVIAHAGVEGFPKYTHSETALADRF
jgi:hypothetical protein